MPTALISQREYARRLGIQHEAVRRRTQPCGGPIPVYGPRKQIDPEEADRLWTALREGRGRGGRRGRSIVVEAEELQRARTAKLVAEAAREELELAARRGELVPRAQAVADAFVFARAQRDAWLAFAARFGPEIAAALDADGTTCMTVLETYVARQLAELAAERFPLSA